MSDNESKLMYNTKYFTDLKYKLPEDSKLRLRIHRAISWLKCANTTYDDDDKFFVFSWIAFNAMYGGNSQELKTERKRFEAFFIRLLHADSEQVIHDCLWDNFSDAPRNLLNNQYLYEPYWKNLMNENIHTDWQQQFENTKKSTAIWLCKRDTEKVLEVLFDRLYVLRNQILHGFATYKSDKNRESLATARRLIEKLLFIFIEIMLKNPDTDWGDNQYMPVKD